MSMKSPGIVLLIIPGAIMAACVTGPVDDLETTEALRGVDIDAMSTDAAAACVAGSVDDLETTEVLRDAEIVATSTDAATACQAGLVQAGVVDDVSNAERRRAAGAACITDTLGTAVAMFGATATCAGCLAALGTAVESLGLTLFLATGPCSACVTSIGWSRTAVTLMLEACASKNEVRPIYALHSNLCLDVKGSSKSNGAPLIQWKCNGKDNQHFVFIDHANDGYEIRALHSGKCLDVKGGSTGDKVPIVQWDCNGQKNQRFRRIAVGDGYVFKPLHAQDKKCLDVAGKSKRPGAALIQYRCNGQMNQRFNYKKGR